jgi:hypothetical protein
MKKLNKELVLDYKKWRSGGFGDNAVGYSDTSLLNPETNQMCCLGQFCLQSGFTKEEIEDTSLPEDLDEQIQGLTKKFDGDLVYTKLNNEAVNINDDEKLTTAQRTTQLQKLFKKNGYTVTLKNFPKKILKEINEPNLHN